MNDIKMTIKTMVLKKLQHFLTLPLCSMLAVSTAQKVKRSLRMAIECLSNHKLYN